MTILWLIHIANDIFSPEKYRLISEIAWILHSKLLLGATFDRGHVL